MRYVTLLAIADILTMIYVKKLLIVKENGSIVHFGFECIIEKIGNMNQLKRSGELRCKTKLCIIYDVGDVC